MKVVSTFHSASSVVDSLKFKLADEHASEYLVVAKLNRLDIYSLLPEGLRHEQGLGIWGRLRAIRAVPVVSRSSLSLLVLTDHPEPELIFLSFTLNSTGSTALKVTKYLSLSERSARPAEFCHALLVDPSGGVAVVSAYMGKLRVVVLDEDGGYDHDFDSSIIELNLLDITFVSTSRDVYTLAMMHIDYQQRLQLLTRDLSIEGLQLSPSPSSLLPSLPVPGKLFSTAMDDDGTPAIIHIPSYEGDDDGFEGGILVLGGRKIMLYDFVSSDMQAKREGKKNRVDKKRTAGDAEASAKEKDREWKKRKPRAAVEWPWAEVTAWCHIDDKGRRYLIGDRYGKLALLSINITGGTTLTLMALGESSAPTTLTYLANHVFFLGSHFGDSKLLQITTTPSSALDTSTLPVPSVISTISPNALNSLAGGQGRNEDRQGHGYVVVGKGSYLAELECFNNLAPILDAVLVDTDGSGQNEIVTCSGGRSTGSIRVVRSGADFSERAIVQGLQNVTNIWPLKEGYHAPEYANVVVSTLQDTHVFRFDNASSVSCIDRNKNSGFITNLPTITVANIVRCTRSREGKPVYADSGLVVQVVSNALLLLEYDSGLREYTRVGEAWTLEKFADPGKEGEWKGREIVAASVNASQVVLALNWGRVVLLILDGDQFIKQRARNFVHNNRDAEISAVSCLPQDSTKNFTTKSVVGFWSSNHVEILSLVAADGTMPTIAKTLTLSSTPRSLLLYNFTSDGPESNVHPHLLIGLTDGSIASFVYKNDQLLDQKLVSIGSLPVSMRSCRIGTKQTVLACGSRTAILFWEKERLMYSPLILKDVTAAAELSTKAYPSSVILSNSDGLVFGNVNNFDKLHIRSIPLGLDNPLRITHIPALRVFVVACRRINPARIGDLEEVTSSIQVFDDTSFNKVGHFNLEQGEESTALLPFTAGPASYLCVAAVTLEDEDTEASKGRIFVLTMSNASHVNLSVIASQDVKGCPYSLISVNSMIAAAVNSVVIVFNMDIGAANTTLERIATWNHNYLVTSLASRADRILVGDAISSISVLRLEDNRLHLVARDYGALWPTSVELMSDSTLIGANSEYNLYTFSLQHSGTRQLLEKDGNYFIGDLVNKFLPGALSSQEVSLDAPMRPQQLFFTSSGLIGVIIGIHDDLALDLTGLQRNLSNFIQKCEGPNHTKYRTPKNVRGRSDAEALSFGFLDGDFLERYLQFTGNSKALRQIMDGESEPEKLTISADMIQKVLESMQSMH